jgi:outer membrane protein assembly factor BamD
MLKIKSNILFILFLLFTSVSCNTEKKTYDSESKQNKTKHKSIAFGKFNKLLKNGNSEDKFNGAIKYFDAKDYTKALILFEELMGTYRGTSKAEEVQYYYANCNYYLGDYILAGYQFRTFVKNYPSSKHLEYCAFMNAYCFYLNSPDFSLEQTDTYLAIKEFHRFTLQFPNSEKILECNNILDKLRDKLDKKSYESSILYYNMANYKSAIVAFAIHIKDFPDTKHEEELKYLTIKSYYLLAINSIESKKQERFKGAVESYIKFIDAFPKSKYIKDAENIYSNSLQNLEKFNKPTS